MNFERLQESLRRARDDRAVAIALECGLIPEEAVRGLESEGEEVTVDALVRRSAVTAADLAKLRRWAEQFERAVLLSLRLSPDAPAEVVRRLQVPGALLGRYVLVEKLGAGGMGTVHRAWDTELSRWVALKLLSGPGDPDSRKRFLREARTAANLDHPGIVPVYEAGQVEGDSYIAMKLVEGASLQGVRLAPRDAAQVIREAALAVDAAHRRGVVHRDLKPGNILRDGSGRVYVGDFGIAREIRVDTRLTASGSVMGTPAYMAPEQARGEQARVGPRSDVYALGATLYELVAGAPPFRDVNLYAVLKKVVEEEAPPLPGAGPDLALVAARCLEKDPARRYASALDLAEDLRRTLEGEPVSARAPGWGYRLRRRLKRSPALAVALAAAFLAAAGAVALGVSALRRGALAREYLEEARSQVDRKNYGLAMEALGRSLALRPDADPARRLKIDCERALEEQRKEAGLRKSLAEASERLRRALDRMKEAKALWRVRTSRREQWEKLFDEALEAADAAVAKYPELPGGPYTRGEILEARGRWKEAVDAFGRALELDRTFAEAWFRRGLCHLSLYTEAMSRKEGLAAAAPHKTRALGDFRRFAELRGQDEADSPESRYAGAVIALAEGRYEECEKACDRLLEGVQTDERVWLLKANAQIYRGLNAAALETLDLLVSSVMPQYPDAFHLRGVAKMSLKDPAGARADFEKLLSLDPKAACGAADLGWARGELGDFAGEIEASTRALELDPANARAYAQRGWAKGELRDHRGKIEDCDRAIALDPGYASAYNYRAVAKMHLDDARGALVDLNRAIELEPEDALRYSNRSQAKAKLGDTSGALLDAGKAIALEPAVANYYQTRATLRSMTGDWKGAVEDHSRAVELEPNRAFQHAQRGFARARLADWKGAAEDYETVLRLEPRSVDGLIGRAEARWKLNDLKGALADATRAVEVEPHSVRALSSRVTVRAHLNDWAGVEADCTKILELDPVNDTAFHNRAGARYKRGDMAGSRSDFSLALELDPSRLESLTGRVLARGGSGDWKGAMEDAERSVESNPASAGAYVNRGWVKGNLKDYAGEIADCTKAIALSPGYAQAYENRAWARARLGDPKGEIEDYTKLIELEPGSGERFSQRAAARAKLKDSAGAIEDYGRAIQCAPKNGRRYADRGRAYRAAKDFARALEDFRKAVELSPSLKKEIDPLIAECEAGFSSP